MNESSPYLGKSADSVCILQQLKEDWRQRSEKKIAHIHI